jgi:DNA phosphorothioation-dependent restriction protein DptG
MSNLRYSKARVKDDPSFDDFINDWFENITNVQDPGTPDGTLADLEEKFNNLISALKEKGIIK